MSEQEEASSFEEETRDALSQLSSNVKDGFDSLGEKFDNFSSLILQMLQHAQSQQATPHVRLQADVGPADVSRGEEDTASALDANMSLDARAAKDQVEAGEFDSDNIYDTLVDPKPRSKQELIAFANVAAESYGQGEFASASDAFKEDFFYWKGEHFKTLPRDLLRSLRDILVDDGAAVRKQGGLPMWKSLGDFIDSHREEESKVPEALPEEEVKEVPQEESKVIPSEKNNQKKDSTVVLNPKIASKLSSTGRTLRMGYESRTTSDSARTSVRPGNVPRLFPKEKRYSGSTTDPLRRNYKIFLGACELCGVEPRDTSLIFQLMKSAFLEGPALVYFMDVVENEAESASDAIERLESHFLGKRARRVNDEVWHDLSFENVLSKRAAASLDTSHENVLNDLLGRIAMLADIRTGSSSETDVMAKTIAAVRDVEAFVHVCKNPPDAGQDLNSALRSCALEADRKSIRAPAREPAFTSKEEISAIASDVVQSFFVDRNLRSDGSNPNGRKFRGYGRARRGHDNYPARRYNGKPPAGNSRRHGQYSRREETPEGYKRRDGRYERKTRFARAYLNEESESEAEVEEEAESDKDGDDSAASYISFTRAIAAMGASSRDLTCVIDAALVDTGSSTLSTIGERLVKAAQVASSRSTRPAIGKTRKLTGIGGIGVSTLGVMDFFFVFGGREYGLRLHILPGFSPLIFSHLDLDDMGFNYQSLHKMIERPEDGYCEAVDMRNGVPYLVFTSGGYFSKMELRAMHRNLGHPSLEKQMKVIENAEISDLPEDTRIQLAKLIRVCKACQLKQGKPRRFLFSIRDPIVGEFNHTLQVDVAKLADGNVLHTIDLGTRFQQGMFISSNDAETAWRIMRRCWINVFAGAPDYIHADAGTNFNSKEFKELAGEMGIIVKIAPTEGHDRVGIVERSHAILRAVYDKLRIDLPRMRKEDRLSMAFRAINDVPNSDTGICPTTLVFGIYPKIPGAGHRGSMAKRASIIRECTNIVIKMKARRVIRDSMRTRNSPSVLEIEKVRNLPAGHDVLVWRENGGWTPYPLVRTTGNQVDVILPSGKISSFSINIVRPFYRTEREDNPTEANSTPKNQGTNVNRIITRSRGKKLQDSNCAVAMLARSATKELYRDARMEEIKYLRELGCFEVVDASHAENHRLYRPTFVDKMKLDGSKRSRLCVAACNDQHHGLFTSAPTIKRISLRLLLAVAASSHFDLFTRDVTKAFVNSKTPLRRAVYLRPPSEMNLEKGKVLKVVKPLYGMPEAPIHWFKTYLDYHRDGLKMEQVPTDPCLLYHRQGGALQGIIGLQVDDTLFAGTPDFAKTEDAKAREFPSKGRVEIVGKPVRFNGVNISKTNGVIQMSQEEFLDDYKAIAARDAPSFDEFRSLRAKLAYIAFSSAPNALVFIAKMAQITESRYSDERTEALRILRKVQKLMLAPGARTGLRFVHIPAEFTETVVCIDAAFAVNHDKSSQLGVLVLLRDTRNGHVNVVHYASIKSKRVCKSVLAAELFAFVDGYDAGFAVRDSVNRMYGRDDIPLSVYTDSHTLYGLCISLSQTTERRLQIDLALIREAYERREITHIMWIAGNINPADDLTKVDKRCGALEKLLATNKFNPPPQAWVSRDKAPVSTSNVMFV